MEEMAPIFQKLRSRVDLQYAIFLMSEYRNMKEVCSYHLRENISDGRVLEALG
jgi:hypothetical protein